jgi:Tol biopolymer transport system component/putative intracellular protease/amidase
MKPTKLFLLIGLLCAVLSTGYLASQAKDTKAEVALQAAIKTETVDGNLKGAIEQYKTIAALPGAGRATVATALLRMGQCYEKLGDTEARKAYERVVRDFADQAEIVAQARVRLAALGGPVSKPTGLQMRRIWTQDAPVVERVLTADGKYFRGIDGATGDVVQFEIASSQRSRITNRLPWGEKGNTIGGQAFSRDGKQIAYNSVTGAASTSDLRIRNLDGSGLRTLFSEKDSAVFPLDWSPDAGSIVALRVHNETTDLIVISTADGSVRAQRSIPPGWFSYERASFSLDGRFVAFSLVRMGSPRSGDVFLMTADGRNEVAVAGHPADDELIGWTPDGRSLVFLSDRSGTWDIWSVPITGGKQHGEPELLKKDFSYDSVVLGFAPDGTLYYGNYTIPGGLYSGEVDLETGNVLVPPALVTTRYPVPSAQPTWSPDGRNLLYISRQGSIVTGNNILTIRSAATGEERFLSTRLRYLDQISWAPDGRSVIALGATESASTEAGIFRIDTETSGITKLAAAGAAPRLCPDGKTLVFVKEGPIITKRNLDTGEESEVVTIRGTSYDLSPDGREVVFHVGGVVKTMSLNGGEPRELLRGTAPFHNWTRDGRYIIVKSRGQLWRIPAQGGEPLKLDLSASKIQSFTLHPDNRRFAFGINEEPKIEVWVLENFLPPSKSLTVATPAPATPIPVQARPGSGGKVLMIVNEGKFADLELMLTREVGVMKSLLEKAGFEVVVATVSNQPLVAGGVTLKPDVKLSDVHLADYKGVIVPCMAVNSKPLPPEGLAIIREAVAKGKPLAAQTGSVLLLGRAGLLAGRKYAGRPSWVANNPELKDAVYSGDGVVQDGRLITSGTCPYTAKQQGLLDGTSRLTEALIAELRR